MYRNTYLDVPSSRWYDTGMKKKSRDPFARALRVGRRLFTDWRVLSTFVDDGQCRPVDHALENIRLRSNRLYAWAKRQGFMAPYLLDPVTGFDHTPKSPWGCKQ